MNLRVFSRNYDLDLIPGALSTLTMGKCVWDGGWFDKPSFDHGGMPNYVFNLFQQKGLITAEENESLLNSLRNLPLVEAAFAQESIDLEIEDALSVNVGEQLKIDVGFDLKRTLKISITNSKGRELPNSLRIQIDTMLDVIKEKYWDEYKNNLRKAYMITQLYYGTINITIDATMEATFEAALPNTNINAKHKLGNSIVYSFDNQNVPFAMRIVRIKHFNS
jgi:hypothetical protein